MKNKAILFGPFVGELSWEFFRFAPYAIYLKKQNPTHKLVVLTRESRFDLYGRYADILLPLRLKNDESFAQDCYKLQSYKEEYYESIAIYFKSKFSKKFLIVSHNYPDIRGWRYKIRWQFPRSKMNYDFMPRTKNSVIAQRVLGSFNGIFDSTSVNRRIQNKNVISSAELVARITNLSDGISSTTFGCIIECIRLVDFVVGDIRSDMSHLSVLLKTPLIHLGTPLKEDYIKLLNPFNTPVIISKNINQEIKI